MGGGKKIVPTSWKVFRLILRIVIVWMTAMIISASYNLFRPTWLQHMTSLKNLKGWGGLGGGAKQQQQKNRREGEIEEWKEGGS